MHSRFVPAAGRRFRYSVRTLFIAMTLAGCVLAWIHGANQQRQFVAALRKSNPGATVLYEDRDSQLGMWARHFVGVDYWASVTRVELFYATDADVAALARFPRLQEVWLERSIDLTDQGLATLARIGSLRVLVLSDAEQITDAGLRHLEALANLEWLQLDLGRFQPSPAAIESLRRALPRCRIEIGDGPEKKPELAATVPHARG